VYEKLIEAFTLLMVQMIIVKDKIIKYVLFIYLTYVHTSYDKMYYCNKQKKY